MSSGPAERDNKVRSVAKLYAVLASEATPESLMDLRNLAYLEALEDFPAWAVNEGVKRWIKGDWMAEGERRQFVPKPAELIRLVKLTMRPVEDELVRTCVLLEAIASHEVELVKPKRLPEPERRAIVAEAHRTAAEASFLARCAEQGIDPDSIPDAPKVGKGLPSDWMKEQAA